MLKRLHQREEGIGGLILRFPELEARGPEAGKAITDNVLRQMIESLYSSEKDAVATRLYVHSELMRLDQTEEGIGGLVLRFPELQKHSPGTGIAITTHVLRQMIGELSWADLSLVSARIYVHNSLKRLHETREGIGSLILRFPELRNRGPGLGQPITDSVLRQMIGEFSRPELESVIAKINEMSR